MPASLDTASLAILILLVLIGQLVRRSLWAGDPTERNQRGRSFEIELGLRDRLARQTVEDLIHDVRVCRQDTVSNEAGTETARLRSRVPSFLTLTLSALRN